MKTAKIVSIVCWLVTALVLIGLAVWLLTSGVLGSFHWGNSSSYSIDFESLKGPFSEAAAYEIPAGDVKKIEINWTTDGAAVTPYDGETIKITEYAQRELATDEKLEYKTSGGTLKIEFCTPGTHHNMAKKELELLVPAALADKVTIEDSQFGTYTVPAAGIQKIDVNWTASSATITPYDGDDIQFTESASRPMFSDEKLVYNVSGDTLEIKYCSPGININMATKALTLLVPRTLAENLDVLDVDATSAEVTISDFRVNTFNVRETSGGSEITNISAVTSDVSSVSGRINIEKMTASKLTLGTVSGGINLTDITADTLIADTTSGGQELSGTFKDIDAGSVSGAIRVSSSIDPDKMYCHTTSGGISVTVPGNADIIVSYSTVSGRFNSDIPVRTGDSGDYRFTSVSGSINLKTA